MQLSKISKLSQDVQEQGTWDRKNSMSQSIRERKPAFKKAPDSRSAANSDPCQGEGDVRRGRGQSAHPWMWQATEGQETLVARKQNQNCVTEDKSTCQEAGTVF